MNRKPFNYSTERLNDGARARTNQGVIMPAWRCIYMDKGGHRLFIDASLPVEGTGVPRVFVADQSGSTPDQTDDGALEIDYHALIEADRIVLAPSFGSLVARVPVRKGADDGGYTMWRLSAGCALHYARLTGIPLLVNDPTLREPLRLDATE